MAGPQKAVGTNFRVFPFNDGAGTGIFTVEVSRVSPYDGVLAGVAGTRIALTEEAGATLATELEPGVALGSRLKNVNVDRTVINSDVVLAAGIVRELDTIVPVIAATSLPEVATVIDDETSVAAPTHIEPGVHKDLAAIDDKPSELTTTRPIAPTTIDSTPVIITGNNQHTGTFNNNAAVDLDTVDLTDIVDYQTVAPRNLKFLSRGAGRQSERTYNRNEKCQFLMHDSPPSAAK
jgi:hypothetical protein